MGRTDEEARRRTEALGVRLWDWSRVGRVAAWVLAAGLLVGTALFVLIEFEVTIPPFEPPASADLVDRIQEGFRQFRENVWPQDLAQRLAYMVSFAALPVVGAALRRFFGLQEVRASMVAGALGTAGLLGVVGELITIGAIQAATNPQYCQCRYAAEQVLGREQVLGAAFAVEEWFLYALFTLSAAGVFLVGRLTFERGLPAAWGILAYLAAALFIAGLVGRATGQDLVADLPVALGGGIVLPAWAIWFARLERRPQSEEAALPPGAL